MQFEKLEYERRLRIHEIYVPSFSIAVLLAVTTFILVLAILEIQSGGSDDTNLVILFVLSSINAVVDVVCFVMFYWRRGDILTHRMPSITGIEDNGYTNIDTNTKQISLKNANLNMLSAFTHVAGDTLRTIAILIAAIVASTTNYKSSLCDAWAAVIVSFTIYISVIPLVYEIWKSIQGRR